MTNEIEPISEFPDGTRFFRATDILEKDFKGEASDLTVDQLILFLFSLSDKPILGRILFFKELFLLYQEIKDKIKVQNPKFVPYRFGAYSFFVAKTLELMEYNGLVRITGKKGSRNETFRLTKKGVEHTYQLRLKAHEKEREGFFYHDLLFSSSKLEGLERKPFSDLQKKRQGWDQLGTQGILRYVYQNYPEYTQKSELKEKYKTIHWGRSKG